jgi:WD40 repeat protein
MVTLRRRRHVRFWNVDNGGNVRNFGGNTDFLYAVGVSSDGAIVADGGEEGIVRLYNGTNGSLIKELLPPDAQKTAAKKWGSSFFGKGTFHQTIAPSYRERIFFSLIAYSTWSYELSFI